MHPKQENGLSLGQCHVARGALIENLSRVHLRPISFRILYIYPLAWAQILWGTWGTRPPLKFGCGRHHIARPPQIFAWTGERLPKSYLKWRQKHLKIPKFSRGRTPEPPATQTLHTFLLWQILVKGLNFEDCQDDT